MRYLKKECEAEDPSPRKRKKTRNPIVWETCGEFLEWYGVLHIPTTHPLTKNSSEKEVMAAIEAAIIYNKLAREDVVAVYAATQEDCYRASFVPRLSEHDLPGTLHFFVQRQ